MFSSKFRTAFGPRLLPKGNSRDSEVHVKTCQCWCRSTAISVVAQYQSVRNHKTTHKISQHVNILWNDECRLWMDEDFSCVLKVSTLKTWDKFDYDSFTHFLITRFHHRSQVKKHRNVSALVNRNDVMTLISMKMRSITSRFTSKERNMTKNQLKVRRIVTSKGKIKEEAKEE